MAVARRRTFRVARRIRRRGRRMVRSFRRRARRSSGGALGKLNIRSILSRQNLEVAGGAIGAGFLTTYVVGRFGASLPGMTNNWVRMGYKIAIPVVGATLVKKFNRNLAQGMVLGGIITVLNDLLASFLTPAATAATGAYLNATPSSAFGAYLGAPQAQRRFTPSYNAVNSFGASPRSVYASPSAFKGSAW